jgi:hypothetical protein
MTIKTQGGKVITKDGKVSCECCCVIYQLYPSNEYGVNFTFADLPDTVQLDLSDTQGQGLGDTSIVYSKVDSPYYVTGGSANVEEALILYKTPTEFFTTDDPSVEATYQAICLIQDNDFPFYLSLGVYECVSGECGPSGPSLQEPIYFFNSSYYNPAPLYTQPDGIESLLNFGLGPESISYDPFPDTLTVSGGISGQATRGQKVLFDWTGSLPNQGTYERYVLPPSFCFQNNPAFGGNGIKFIDNIGAYRGENFLIYFDYVSNIILNETLDPVAVVKSNSCNWKIKTPTGTFTKSGVQNSPIGDYGPYSVS